MTNTQAIEVDNLSHTYQRWGHRVRALANLSLTLSRGEWVNLVGPNGSGKSTLLGLLTGRLNVQSGRVLVAGNDVSTTPRSDLARALFIVQQDPTAGTAPTLTVGEHLMLADECFRRDNWAHRAAGLLGSVHLDVPLNQPVSTLSGGQRQLLVLLMAMQRPAPLVLLDEPLAALDPDRAQQCDNALGLLRAAGKTLLLVTHDLDYAVSRGDRVVSLVGGRVVLDERGDCRARKSLVAAWANSQGSIQADVAGSCT